jgi:hypothetical protein
MVGTLRFVRPGSRSLCSLGRERRGVFAAKYCDTVLMAAPCKAEAASHVLHGNALVED